MWLKKTESQSLDLCLRTEKGPSHDVIILNGWLIDVYIYFLSFLFVALTYVLEVRIFTHPPIPTQPTPSSGARPPNRVLARLVQYRVRPSLYRHIDCSELKEPHRKHIPIRQQRHRQTSPSQYQEAVTQLSNKS